MANSNLMILFMLLIFGYFVLYFGGRKYLEKFENDYDDLPTGQAISDEPH